MPPGNASRQCSVGSRIGHAYHGIGILAVARDASADGRELIRIGGSQGLAGKTEDVRRRGFAKRNRTGLNHGADAKTGEGRQCRFVAEEFERGWVRHFLLLNKTPWRLSDRIIKII